MTRAILRFTALTGLIALGLVAMTPPSPAQNLIISDAPSSVLRYDIPTATLNTLFDPFNTASMSRAAGIVAGPDGLTYVSDNLTDEIKRYDTVTGAYVDTLSDLYIGAPVGLAYRGGGIFISNAFTDEVLRYDIAAGTFSIFVSAGSGGLTNPTGLAFGPDGLLYVCSAGTDQVLRYNGATGAFVDILDKPNAGNLKNPADIAFPPLGQNCYVTSFGDDRLLRYNYVTNKYLSDVDPSNTGGRSGPIGLAFSAGSGLFVANYTSQQILLYNVVTETASVFAKGLDGPTYLMALPKPATATIFGQIRLLGCVDPVSRVRFIFKPVGGGAAITKFATLDSLGEYMISDIPYNEYKIAIKGSKWLQRVIMRKIDQGYVYDVDATLLPGDANNDNHVDIFDLGTLAESFNTTPADANWNPECDFNCDMSVDIFDLATLAEVFNTDGEEL